VILRLRAPAAWVIALAGALPTLAGCSSLTYPDDITIAPEPPAAPAAPAPPPQPAPAPAGGPQAPPQAMQGGG
jgi:hypothetical protein